MKYQYQECIGSRVRALSRKIDRIYRKHLANSGVTENQLSIMMALHETGLIEQKQISELLSLEKSSLSRNLVRLVQCAYVKKTGEVNRPVIQLTDLGLKKVQELTPHWENAMNEINVLMTDKDKAAFDRFEKSISKL